MIKVFKDFLPDTMANQLYESVLDTSGSWWKTAYVSNGGDPVYLDDSIRHSLINIDSELSRSLAKGEFSYKFKRSTDHPADCTCYQCDFKHYVQYVLKDHIEKEFDTEEIELNTMFFSIYQSGDYLSTHRDQGRGNYAFILNLSKNWRAEYGGLLHSEGKYFVPEFNSLIIIDLEEDGVDHFVSEVSQRVISPRVAVSGWFKKSK